MGPAPAFQDDLFGAPSPALPAGMRYETGFIDVLDEAALLDRLASLPLLPMQYRGYKALRRCVSYGSSYDFSAGRLEPAEPIPGWLLPLRDKVAAWLALAPDAFRHALVAEYRPGPPLGWHRDVPDYQDVVGVSLGTAAFMRLRPYPPRQPKRADVLRLALEPRSIYLLRGPARWAWQHSIAPASELRYSITLRTVRAGRVTS